MARGGVKGRSGRKAHLEDKTVAEILALSARTINQALNDLTLPIQFRAELASKIYTKAMPSVVDATVDAQVTEMSPINKENRIDGFLIGAPINAPEV